MRKLFIILLVAIFISYSNQETVVDDDVILRGSFQDAWNKVKDVFKDAKAWLQKYDLWNPLVTLLKDGLEYKAKQKCEEKFEDSFLCKEIVKYVRKWIDNHWA